MKKKSPKHKYVKIRYDDLQVRVAELYMLLLWFFVSGLAGFAIYTLIKNQNHTNIRGYGAFIPALIFVFLVAVGLSYLCYLAAGRVRRKRNRENQFIKRNGTKVIGEIISLDKTEVHTKDGGTNFTYSYNVQYKNPTDKSQITIQTPSVIKDNMLIKEADLPLKVVVYVYDKQTFVESLIDPPFKEMLERRILKILPVVVFIETLVGMLIFSGLSNNTFFDGIMALCFCGFIISLFFIFLNKYR